MQEKKMERIKKGSSLSDYVIPTLLIGVVFGIGLYSFVKNQTLLNFVKSSSNFFVKDKTLILNSTQTTLVPGFLGGTTDKPVTSCMNNSCLIDFGEFILSGIPEEINEIATSSRGGEQTNTYANILNQLARYVEQSNNNSELAEYLRRLANNALKMSIVEKQGDNFANNLNQQEALFFNADNIPEKNINSQLSSISAANLKDSDYNLLLSSERYMKDMGLIQQEDLQNFAMITLSIKQDWPELRSWQKSFLDQMLSVGTEQQQSEAMDMVPETMSGNGIDDTSEELSSSGDSVEEFADNVSNFLATNQEASEYLQTVLAQEPVDLTAADTYNSIESQTLQESLSALSTSYLGNYNQYSIAIKETSSVSTLVHSSSSTVDPGYIFADLVQNPPESIPDYMKTLVQNIGQQITTIGNAIDVENVTINTETNTTSQQFIIDEMADIKTKIIDTILKNFTD